MAKGFYSVYVFADINLPSSGESSKSHGIPDSVYAKQITCFKNGFSWWYAMPYVGGIIALSKRQFLAGFFLLFTSFFCGSFAAKIIDLDPLGNNIIVIISYFLTGVYGPALVESSLAYGKNKILAGIYFAESEDHSLRRFFDAREKK